MSGPTTDPQLNPETGIESRSAPNKKAVVVGLYGVAGSGKTFLLNQLKQELGEQHFAFYEGSQKIAKLVSGGLDAFQKLEEREKWEWRQLAIETIRKECVKSGRVAVVAKHFMFWPEEEEAGRPVYTQNDLDIFTHVLYLDLPNEVILQRRLADTDRNRPSISITHLGKWQQAEKTQLRDLCHNHSILFSLISPQQMLLKQVSPLLRDFQHHNEKHNLSLAKSLLDETVVASQGQLETVLVMDANRTLAAVDTGMLFWDRISGSQQAHKGHPLKTLFSSAMGYSYTAFRQATLLYEEAADDQNFDAICDNVASAVVMYPEFIALLHLVEKEEHVSAVIISCRLRRV
jgi:adenylate kinase